MPSVSKKQQRFFGIVRAAQKGTLKGKKTLEVQRAAASMKKKDVKDFASTKHKGLPEKKVTKESFNEDYVKELEDGLVKMDYPSYDEVDKLMCKIAKENDIDTTTLHMAFKTKHLMVPDDWAKKKMMEPIIIPKTPVGEMVNPERSVYMGTRKSQYEKKERKISKDKSKTAEVSKEKNLDMTDPRQRMKASSLVRRNQMKGKINNPEGSKSSVGEKMYEGTSYGLYKGSGKPGGAMKAYLDKKKKEKKQVKEESHSPFTTPELQRKKKIEDFKKNADRVLRGKKSDDGPSIQKEGSLHKWFKGSKSKDGKGGWVNVVTGGTCASDEPGEGTPKCVSSSKRASMTKAERKSAARRKKAADPNQQSKSGAAKPTYVSTDKKKKVNEEKVSKDHPNHPKNDYKHADMTDQDAAKIRVEKKTAKKQVESGNRSRFTDKYYPEKKKDLKYPVGNKIVKTGKLTKEEFIAILEDAKMQRQTDINLDRLHDKFSKMDQSMPSNKHMLKRIQKEKKRRQDKAKRETLNPTTQINDNFMPEISEDCWDGYEKKGMKTMFGKRYPNCVKKKKTRKESFEMNKIDAEEHNKAKKKAKIRNLAKGNTNPNEKAAAEKKAGGPKLFGEERKEQSPEFNKRPQGAIARAMAAKGLTGSKTGETGTKRRRQEKYKPKPTEPENKGNLNKFTNEPVEESKKPINYRPKPTEKDPANMAKEKGQVKKGEPDYRNLAADYTPDLSMTEGAAWTRKAGKNQSGGLNEKGRRSYERENPGSDLKAPSKKKGNKRRASFCARMKGMKKKRTSAKTARDPDSRINKSLRAWNCSYEPETGELISEKIGGMLKAVKRKKEVLNQSQKKPQKAMDAGARLRRKKQREEHRRYVSDIIPDHLMDEFTPVIEEGKSAKKCKSGQYYCFDDKKCKPIPRGMRIGYGGMLRPDKEEETKGKKDGNGNGNGNGSNGNGHSGGNGGSNGGDA